MFNIEKHIAVVANTDDPEKRGRIQVRCAGILGSEDAILSEWVEPCFDWGFFIIPDVGEQIEIEVVSGSDRDEVNGQAFLEEPDLRYRGKRFYGEGTDINEMFSSSNYGKRRGFASPGGHILMFDDTDDARKINLAWYSGDGQYAMFSVDEDGSVVIANRNGSLIYLNAVNNEVAIVDEHGNSISTDSNGIKIIDTNSNLITLQGDDIQVLAQNGVTISCASATIDAGDLYLGGFPAPDAVLKGTAFNTALAAWAAQLITVLGTCVPSPPTGLTAFTLYTNTVFLPAVLAALSTKSFTQ